MRPTQLLGYLDAVYGERLAQPYYTSHTVLILWKRSKWMPLFSMLVCAVIAVVYFVFFKRCIWFCAIESNLHKTVLKNSYIVSCHTSYQNMQFYHI